jgi:hypothetical protein
MYQLPWRISWSGGEEHSSTRVVPSARVVPIRTNAPDWPAVAGFVVPILNVTLDRFGAAAFNFNVTVLPVTVAVGMLLASPPIEKPVNARGLLMVNKAGKVTTIVLLTGKGFSVPKDIVVSPTARATSLRRATTGLSKSS